MNDLVSEALAPPTVVCVTCCTDLETLASSTLIFHTLRIGFPTARVVILDNHSLLAAQRIIARFPHSHGGTGSPSWTITRLRAYFLNELRLRVFQPFHELRKRATLFRMTFGHNLRHRPGAC
jgi:hypothetical protein